MSRVGTLGAGGRPAIGRCSLASRFPLWVVITPLATLRIRVSFVGECTGYRRVHGDPTGTAKLGRWWRPVVAAEA